MVISELTPKLYGQSYKNLYRHSKAVFRQSYKKWEKQKAMSNNYTGEIAPHGGVLVNRVVSGAEREKIIARAEQAKSAHHYRTLNSVNLSDLEMIAVGAMSPLTGFMGKADYENVVND